MLSYHIINVYRTILILIFFRKDQQVNLQETCWYQFWYRWYHI